MITPTSMPTAPPKDGRKQELAHDLVVELDGYFLTCRHGGGVGGN